LVSFSTFWYIKSIEIWQPCGTLRLRYRVNESTFEIAVDATVTKEGNVSPQQKMAPLWTVIVLFMISGKQPLDIYLQHEMHFPSTCQCPLLVFLARLLPSFVFMVFPFNCIIFFVFVVLVPM
jgi:hypothetical protein